MWSKILSGFTPTSQSECAQIVEFKELISGWSLDTRQDGIKWRWSSSELFSVKSAYQFLGDGGVIVKCFHRLWTIRTPLKVKIFTWLLLKNKVITSENLLKKGWSGEDRYVYCLEESETVDHLFAGCACVTALLERLLPNKRFFRNSASVKGIWDVNGRIEGAQGGRELATIAATWWIVWLERNRRIFVKTKRQLGYLLVEIRSLIDFWFSCCPHNSMG